MKDLHRLADVLERIAADQAAERAADRERQRPLGELERAAYELKIERLKHGGRDTGEPRQINVLTIYEAVQDEAGGRLLENFSRKIPAGAWVEVESGAAEIACPCGEECLVQMAVPKMCDEAAAGDEPEKARCPRAYLWDGADVRVAFSPHSQRIPNAQTAAAS